MKVHLTVLNWERFRKSMSRAKLASAMPGEKRSDIRSGVNPRLSRSSELLYGSPTKAIELYSMVVALAKKPLPIWARRRR